MRPDVLAMPRPPRSRLAGIASLLAVSAAFLVPGVGPVQAAPTPAEGQLISEIFADINRERTSRGLTALPLDNRLAAQAQAVAEQNRLTCPEDACHGSYPEAEVSAWRLGYPSGSSAHGWIVSDPHRHLVLSTQATALGVGLACAPDGSYHAIAQLAGVNATTPVVPRSAPVTTEEQGSWCPRPGLPTTAPTAVPPTTAPPTTPPTTEAPPPPPTTSARPVTTAVPPAPASPPTTEAPTIAPPPTLPPTTLQPAVTAPSPPTSRPAPTTAPASGRDDPVLQAASGGTGPPASSRGALVAGAAAAAGLAVAGVALWRRRRQA